MFSCVISPLRRRKESERIVFGAARTLRGSSDSLLLIREKPQILIMGDFNDTPQDRSISEIFAAQAFPENTQITDSHLVPIIICSQAPI